MYAAGKIPGGFIKREGRPTEHSILASRLVDRPIRPLFPKGYRNDVQVVITVLSADMENDSDVIGIVCSLCRDLDLRHSLLWLDRRRTCRLHRQPGRHQSPRVKVERESA